MQFTVERGGPLLPFLLEHVKGSRNHVKSLLARGQVQVDGAAVLERLVELSGGREDGAEEFFRALRESADAV